MPSPPSSPRSAIERHRDIFGQQTEFSKALVFGSARMTRSPRLAQQQRQVCCAPAGLPGRADMRGYVALVLFPLSLPVIIGRRLRRRSISPARRVQASIRSTEFEHRALRHVGSLSRHPLTVHWPNRMLSTRSERSAPPTRHGGCCDATNR